MLLAENVVVPRPICVNFSTARLQHQYHQHHVPRATVE